MATTLLTKAKPDQAEPELDTSNEAETPTSARPKRGRYISDSILERRRRMLEVAKEMIAEGGPEGFTIRELGRRAKVSVTTIYATYGDKEGLIAAAIQDYFDSLPVARVRQSSSIAGTLASMDLAREAILANKPYARHYAELFFSSTVDSRIYDAIHDTAISSGGTMPWLQKAMREGDVVPGLTYEQIIDMAAKLRLLNLHDWAQGRVSDDSLGVASKTLFLTFVRGVTRGATQARVEAELKKQLRAAGVVDPE